MVDNIISVIQIIAAIILIGAVLLQAPEGGLSPVFGGGGEMYRSKRNVEKFLIGVTIAMAAALVITSIILLLSHLH